MKRIKFINRIASMNMKRITLINRSASMNMKRISLILLCASMNIVCARADNEGEGLNAGETSPTEFVTDELLREGFLSGWLNRKIATAMEGNQKSEGKQKMGRSVTDYVTPPKLGGFIIGRYSWTDQSGAHGGDGFGQRMVRLYIEGKLLGDFHYRVQAQVSNASFHVKDYYIEWSHWKELAVRLGQYKRAFLFENQISPWDLGYGDFAQIVKRFAGMGDYNGEGSSNGGRDQGLELHGEAFSGRDGHRFLHYRLQVMNGQGINTGDANRRKDVIGMIQVQPVRGLFVGLCGWTGDYVSEGVRVERKRWAAGVRLDRRDWSARAEYANSIGHKVSEYDPATNAFRGRGRSDAWYVSVGAPWTRWLKVYAKYDAFRDQADMSSMKTIYSVAPNFQLHKNLQLQVQYNYVHDKNAEDRDYHELWAQAYVRF